eukprot:178622-Pleurochrysis_carterae.AAC.1
MLPCLACAFYLRWEVHGCALRKLAPALAPVSQIVGFLISFISKERQTEVMVEKLCSRFGATDDVGRQRDVAFCLGALGHTERSVRKLHELFKTYANLLTDAEASARKRGACRVFSVGSAADKRAFCVRVSLLDGGS